MGAVYRAIDTRLNRSVAIKVVDEEFSERFQSEARAISSLNHPSVCTLYDVGANYLVMELIEGETLADRLKTGPLPVDRAVEFGAQIAKALAAAHAKGVVHRDLKPANIMVTEVRRQGAGLRRREGRRVSGRDGDDEPGDRRHAGVHGARAAAGRLRAILAPTCLRSA